MCQYHTGLWRKKVKRVEVVGIEDKRQLTAMFAGSSSGDFLPLQLIYEGKTDCCVPHYKLSSTWHVTKTKMHWSNEQTMKEYFTKIIFPYIQEKRTALKLSSEQPTSKAGDEQAALFIFDNFKAQCTPSVLNLRDQHNINVALIPPNCTDRLQPLNLSVKRLQRIFT